jgi:hypothetical protein
MRWAELATADLSEDSSAAPDWLRIEGNKVG